MLTGCTSEVATTAASSPAGLTSGASPMSGSNDDGGSAIFSDIDDPMDRAFLTELRDKGLLPSDSRSAVPEATFIEDAKELCRLAASSGTIGESEQYIRFGFSRSRASHAQTYGLTEAQTTDVMIISARVYCPESVELIERALQ